MPPKKATGAAAAKVNKGAAAGIATRTAAQRKQSSKAAANARNPGVSKSKGPAKKAPAKAPVRSKAAPRRAPARGARVESEEDENELEVEEDEDEDEDEVEEGDGDSDIEMGDADAEPVGPIAAAKARILQLKIEALERQATRDMAQDAAGGIPGANTANGFAGNHYSALAFGGAVEDDGESLLSPSHAATLPLFKDHNNKDIIAIARNKFNPLNLPNLALYGEAPEPEPEVTLGFDDGQLKQTKQVGKITAFGKTPHKWIACFNLYMPIMIAFHGNRDAGLNYALHVFMDSILKLSKIYQWEPVLKLAIDFHTKRCQSDPYDADSWVLTPTIENNYLKMHQLLSSAPSTTNAKPKKKDTALAKDNDVCNNWNRKVCSWGDDCRRKHVCLDCSGLHKVVACPKHKKD